MLNPDDAGARVPRGDDCPHCDGGLLQRSRRRRFERLFSVFGFLPFRCDTCGRRMLRIPPLQTRDRSAA
jgi:hypothetical protein